jgi:3-oxoacyl-[acyl-carrier-protein] synthase II
VTEHGNVETENEIYLLKGYDYDTSFWSHHHNPRTVANNPAGEVALNMGITGPHYTIGAACAAGNAGLIQGAQMLRLGDCDVALAGGVSESIHTFGIFASFKSQGALACHDDPTKASRPFDVAERHRRGRRGLHVCAGTA